MSSLYARRRFLAAGLGAAAGLSAAGRLDAAASPPDASGPLALAVVGLGDYARVVIDRAHAARRTRIAALLTGDRAKGLAWAREHGVPATHVLDYGALGRLRDDFGVEAVHLCLPVGLHAEFATRAFDAGLHVLCEKPLAATSAEAHALIAHAERRGLTLMPAYRARFSGHIQHMLERLADGRHGPLRLIDAHKGFVLGKPVGDWRFDPALAGAGCLYDIGIYSVQLSRWFAGRLPRRVSAIIDPGADDPRFAHVEPHIAWSLDFGDGVLATGSASWRYRQQNHVRVVTASAGMLLEPATPAIGERLTLALDEPARLEEPALPPRDQIPVMLDHFAAVIRDGAAPQVPASEGYADLVAMEAILRAAREGVTVALPGPAAA